MSSGGLQTKKCVVYNLTLPGKKITGREIESSNPNNLSWKKVLTNWCQFVFLFLAVMDIKDTTSTQLQVTDSFFSMAESKTRVFAGRNSVTYCLELSFFPHCQPFPIKKRAQAGILYMRGTIERVAFLRIPYYITLCS